MDKRLFTQALAAGLLLPAVAPLARAQPASGKPITVGSTISLTGPLAGTAIMHRIAGEIFIELLNRRGGLLGRPVEWIVRDDQSRPDLARTLYEQLVTSDKVDLLMGPYATANSISAIGVAQRYNKVLITNSFGIPSLAKYDMHFPAYVMGHDPGTTVPTTILEALQAGGAMPRTVALVSSKFPSVQFLSAGAREVFRKRGLQEKLWLEWDFGTREFGPIANRLKEAAADFVWLGTIGPESMQLLDAMSKIDYRPRLHFHLYPTPGPMAQSPLGANALSVTTFEQHPPFTGNAAYAEAIRIYNERAARANLPDTSFELQPANAYTGWQVLEAGVKGAGSLDDKRIAEWLKKNRVDTIIGNLRFDGPNNYGDDLNRVKQVQGGKWIVIHPKEWALPGSRLAV
jgi:ABC-type branched-subunit amino acid transport system substrate-binding protein